MPSACIAVFCSLQNYISSDEHHLVNSERRIYHAFYFSNVYIDLIRADHCMNLTNYIRDGSLFEYC